tara:strand:- start:58 stop:465 length:408 start_codon:yes stop_codon:yes gene_type:complete
MTSLTFHNDTASINHLWYESHKNILANVCIQLGQSDKIEEMTNKLLGEKMKMKILKDPNKPKRPKSSYLFFCDKHRPALMKKMRKKGEVKLGDIAKKLGAAWKNISEKEKAVFIGQSVKAKTEYEEAMEKYNLTL